MRVIMLLAVVAALLSFGCVAEEVPEDQVVNETQEEMEQENVTDEEQKEEEKEEEETEEEIPEAEEIPEETPEEIPEEIPEEETVIECTDTDAEDMYAKGKVSKGENDYFDLCYDADTVTEYYCDNENVETKQITCPSGYSCDDGACVYSVPECTKSDGNSIYVYGYADYNDTKYYDYCKNSTHVYEYYCSNPPHTVPQYCGWGYGCSAGVCVPQCSDTDGGLDLSVRGTIRYGNESETDYCSDGGIVIEHYCGITGILSSIGVCSSGTVCSAGECVSECVDYDGNDPSTPSYIEYGGVRYDDVCVDGSTVREYICTSSTAMDSVEVECTGGDVNYCSSGHCISLR